MATAAVRVWSRRIGKRGRKRSTRRGRLGAIRDMVRLEARALELLKGDADGPDTDRAAIDLINELERLAPAVADAIDDNAPLVD